MLGSVYKATSIRCKKMTVKANIYILERLPGQYIFAERNIREIIRKQQEIE